MRITLSSAVLTLAVVPIAMAQQGLSLLFKTTSSRLPNRHLFFLIDALVSAGLEPLRGCVP
jgi:hypothetical protein